MIERWNPLSTVTNVTSQVTKVRDNSENERIWTLFDRQREQILADCQAEITEHEFQANFDRRSTEKLNETIESKQEELHRAQAEERRQRYQHLLHEQLLKQNWDLREAHEKSFKEMEELKKFQGPTFDTIARGRLVGDQDTILELTAKTQELQNETYCMDDSRDFKDAESVRTKPSHVANQPVFSHLIQFLVECLAVRMECRAATMGCQVFGTRMVYRETFLQLQLCLLQHVIRRNWVHGVQAYQNRFTHQR